MVRSVAARSTLLAIATVLVLGCGGATASTTPAPTVSPTGTPTTAPSASASAEATPAASHATTGRIELAEKGLALTLPTGWESLPLDPEALKAMVAAIDPDSDWGKVIKQTVDSGQLSLLTLWALDMDADVVGQRNLTVIVQPAASIPMSLVESTLKGQLSAIQGVGTITATEVTLPAGEALRLDYSIDVPTVIGVSVKSEQSLYWIQGDKITVIMTVTGKGAATDAEFKSIVESVEEI